MAHSKLALSFAAGSILLAQLLSYGPVSAETPQLIKVQGNSAVYWITGLTRHAFPLSRVYTSWFGSNFSTVTTVTAEQLASYTLSKNVLYKPGSLIKIQTDPKVYLVVNEAGALEWIPSEEEFKKRGLSFKDVRDVPDTLFSDYYFATASDFATPQNAPAPVPMTTSTPIVEAPKPTPVVLAIKDLSVTSFVGADGVTQAKFAFSTTLPAAVTISYAVGESATSTVSFDSATNFSKTVSVYGGFEYRYVIAAGSTVLANGTFVSYSDIVVAPISNLVPVGTLIVQPIVTVGGFTIENKSTSVRTATQFSFQFDSGSTVTQNVTKTLQIVRLNADNSVGALIGEKTIPSGTGITNSTNVQKIALDETFAIGETKRYGLIFKNLDQINLGLVSPTDTFVPFVTRVDFLGDISINLSKNSLATLIYFK